MYEYNGSFYYFKRLFTLWREVKDGMFQIEREFSLKIFFEPLPLLVMQFRKSTKEYSWRRNHHTARKSTTVNSSFLKRLTS